MQYNVRKQITHGVETAELASVVTYAYDTV